MTTATTSSTTTGGSFIYDDFFHSMQKEGVSVDKTNITFDCYRGSGSFSGSTDGDFFEKHMDLLPDEVRLKMAYDDAFTDAIVNGITASSSNTHRDNMSVSVEMDTGWFDDEETGVEDLDNLTWTTIEDNVTEWFNDKWGELMSSLRSEAEYLESDECIERDAGMQQLLLLRRWGSGVRKKDFMLFVCDVQVRTSRAGEFGRVTIPTPTRLFYYTYDNTDKNAVIEQVFLRDRPSSMGGKLQYSWKASSNTKLTQADAYHRYCAAMDLCELEQAYQGE